MYELQSTLSAYARRKFSSGEISTDHLRNIMKVHITEYYHAYIYPYSCLVIRRWKSTWGNASRSSATSRHASKKEGWLPSQGWYLLQIRYLIHLSIMVYLWHSFWLTGELFPQLPLFHVLPMPFITVYCLFFRLDLVELETFVDSIDKSAAIEKGNSSAATVTN